MPLNPAIPGVNQNSGPYTALPGLTPPSIGGLGGAVAQENIFKTLFDYNPFSVLQDVYRRHVDVSTFRLVLGAMGMKRAVDAPTTGHYEEDFLRGLVKIGAVTTPSAGAGTNLLLTLDASVMFNAGAAVGGAARQASEVKINDILLSPTGKLGMVTAKNEAVTPHTITVRPLKAAVDLAGAFLAAGEYAIVGNAWAEGTGLPLGSMTRITEYSNTFQIIKQGGGGTGTEASNRLFVNFYESGDDTIAVMSDRSWKLYEEDFSHVLLLGQSINNVTQVANLSGLDVPVNGTEGLIPWVSDNGHTHVFNPINYTLADFDNLSRTLVTERAGVRSVMTLDGFDIYTTTENLLFGESGSDLTPFLMKEMASKFESLGDADMQLIESSDFGMSIGFKAVKKSGITYSFKMMNEFNNVKGLGAATYTYINTRLVMPVGEVMNMKTNTRGFAWGYEYKAKGSYSREVQYENFGGLGTTGLRGTVQAVHQYDHIQWGILSEIAGHFACANKVIMQIPS